MEVMLQPVDSLVPGGADNPGSGILRDALARPLLDRGGERLVRRFLCQVEIAES